MYLDWKSPKKFGGHGPRFRNTGANKRVGNDISTGLWCVDFLCILNEWWERWLSVFVLVCLREGLEWNFSCAETCQLQKGANVLKKHFPLEYYFVSICFKPTNRPIFLNVSPVKREFVIWGSRVASQVTTIFQNLRLIGSKMGLLINRMCTEA